jgi:exopolysaccharide biosynthesis polyprenyl glycosylphosphotransferase
MAIADRPRATLPSGEPANPPVAGWEPRYRRVVIASDVFVTVLIALILGGLFSVSDDAGMAEDLLIGGLTVLVVLCSLAMNRAWQVQVVGQGAEEYSRLSRGMFAAAVALGLTGFATGTTAARPWVYIVIPVSALTALLFRYLLRQVLHRARYEGECLLQVMAAGSVDTVRDLIARTKDAPYIGWRVAAICTADGTTGTVQSDIDGVPVVGRLDDVAEHVRRGGYRIVAITADPHWTPRRLQQLAWKLEGSGAEMVVAPTLMEVAGPRLHVSGVLGMPLLQVTAPAFTGTRRAIKNIIDRVGAVVVLVLAAPIMLVSALAIAVDSRGPVFFTLRRVGKDGKEFTMVKFRTLVPDVDHLNADLAYEDANVFKMGKNPEVTRVGAFLRRYSIDELPQLFNVLTGAMSLVGPRPPFPDEIGRYGPDVRRRLLVKPGLTGLWQVSGRSDLSWEEAVRLDLQYVEDWSLTLDAMILWKTLRAVLGGQGSY